MEIKRDKYLNDLIIRMNNGMIKVVTGIRRSGKSYLIFKIFKKYLIKNKIPENHIISIVLDKREERELRNPDVLLNYIKSNIQDDNIYYVLIDEIQLLESFEEVLNSLLNIENVDVYVTGSNSKFLSKDVITEFRGRGDEIHIFPLTFKEYMQAYDGDKYKGFSDYITYGGLPLTLSMKTAEQKVKYLSRLFEETYIKDIRERYKIEKIQEINDLINILASSIGSLTNPTKIKDSFKSIIHSDISLNTIKQYIDYLKDAFLINESYRYDVKGRKYIGTPIKYFFEDVGLRNARLNFRQIEESHLMENVVYNELRARGFQIDVGVVPVRKVLENGVRERAQLEIDFIASLGNKKYYIQSAYSIPDELKEKQEKASLLSVKDSFKKIIIVKDIINNKCDENGIATISIYDFLLNDNSLDL